MISIGFRGVSLGRGDRTLLARVHLSIAPGELVVVTGPRGAGKSLLLAAAAGAIDPQEGEVSIAGRGLASLQRSARPYVRRNIGYLPGEPPFVRDETALENIVLALAVRGFEAAEADLIARRTLAGLGGGDDGGRAPEPLGERLVRDLSAGERRLVGLARALAGPPPIVVLDEPSAGLDGGDRDRLLEALLEARAAGAAILCASNDGALVAALAAQGARHLVLEEGELRGERGVVRAVADPRDDGAGDAPERDARGGVVLGFPGRRPAREAS